MASYLSRSILSLSPDSDEAVRDRIHERILSRCTPEGECSIYDGSWDGDGKPKVKVGARTYSLIRVVAWVYFPGFELWGSRVPVHTCTSPACANPEHVQITNSHADAMEFNRKKAAVSNRNGGRWRNMTRAAATERANRIREERAHATIGQLAMREGVSEKAIRKILQNQTYRILPQ